MNGDADGATIAGSLCKSWRIWTQVLMVDQASYPLIFLSPDHSETSLWYLAETLEEDGFILAHSSREHSTSWILDGTVIRRAWFRVLGTWGWICFSSRQKKRWVIASQWPTPSHSPLVFIPSMKVAPSPSNMPLARERVFNTWAEKWRFSACHNKYISLVLLLKHNYLRHNDL